MKQCTEIKQQVRVLVRPAARVLSLTLRCSYYWTRCGQIRDNFVQLLIGVEEVWVSILISATHAGPRSDSPRNPTQTSRDPFFVKHAADLCALRSVGSHSRLADLWPGRGLSKSDLGLQPVSLSTTIKNERYTEKRKEVEEGKRKEKSESWRHCSHFPSESLEQDQCCYRQTKSEYVGRCPQCPTSLSPIRSDVGIPGDHDLIACAFGPPSPYGSARPWSQSSKADRTADDFEFRG